MANQLQKKLRLFHERAEVIKSNKEFFNSNKVQLVYKNQQLKTIVTHCDIYHLKALLLDLRFFLMKDEVTNFNHICNQINLHIRDNSELTQKVAEAHKAWNTLLTNKSGQSIISLVINTEELNTEDNINMWMNGKYFHTDEEQNATLETINSTPFGAISHFVFIDDLQKLGQLLLWFDKEIIQVLIKTLES